MRTDELVAYLDTYLRVREVGDDNLALNGLQCANGGEVSRIAVAVDSGVAVIEKAIAQHADFLIVHHGMFWSGVQPLTGRYYRRMAALVRAGMAVYGAHLPLDVHPEVGNNAVLARLLGFEVRGWWGEYKGVQVGAWCETDQSRDAVAQRLNATLGVSAKVIAGGPERVRKVGIVTGAGGSLIEEAAQAGIDTLITGEGKHHSFFDAEELGVNVFYAGHYATETVGVKALGEHLAAHFGLPWFFVDHPTGL